MISNYIKIALRNLWKHKLFSFINIFGLAAGMAVCVLVLINIKSAFEYDEFHPHPERTFRIITDIKGKESSQSWSSTPTQLAKALRKYSFIQECIQVYPGSLELASGNDMLSTDVNFVDQGFFQVFGFKLLRGSFDKSPYTIVLSTDAALRHFGKQDPIGKRLKHKNGMEFTVTGILAEPEGKSHLAYSSLVSLSTRPLLADFKNRLDDPLNIYESFTYIMLKEGSSITSLNNALPAISKQITSTIPPASQTTMNFRAQSLNQINPGREELLRATGGGGAEISISFLLIQTAIGLVALLLAGFNYVNLTLARSIGRAREVGVRKVLGAQKWQLFVQFITESSILAVFALLLSLFMIELLKPFDMVRDILQNAKWDVTLWTIVIVFTLLSGLLAGLIPAKILSAFKPVNALKKYDRPLIFKGLTLRKVLVIVQFTISLTGIIFMLIIYQQQKFMAEGEYGFSRENILNIDLGNQDHRLVAAEVISQPGVEQVTASSGLLGMHLFDTRKVQTDDKKFSTSMGIQSADANFVEVMGLKILNGENLLTSIEDSSGSTVLLNEKAIQELHFKNPREAVGQLVWLNDSTQVRVVGIVKDFHHSTMRLSITPMMIRYEPQNFRIMQVKVSPSVSPQSFKASISLLLAKMIKPGEQNINWFDQFFYDSHFHAKDQLFLGVLTGLILSIACLGLLGMVTYTSEIRTREIGIRKVFGATVAQVVMLLSRQFIRLLVVAALIAFPAGIIIGSTFFNNYAYRAPIGPGTILSGFLALLLIGGLTIGLQTYRTAIANPVKSLRTE
jgi:putative ABC transport system permease protein